MDKTPTSETKPFSLRIPPDLRHELEQWADEEDRELANLIRHILRNALQAHRAECARAAETTPDPH
jgi:hypothetical protein